MKLVRGFLPCICWLAYTIPFMLTCEVNSAAAQTGSANPLFEVATIKPVIVDASHLSNAEHAGVHVYSARAYYRSMTLKSLVRYAYNIQPFQVSGPASIERDYYDIEARFPKGANVKDERKMLQALLKERFKLTFHIDKKELGSFVLVIGKNGSKLKPSLPDLQKSGPDAPSKPGEKGLEMGNEQEVKGVMNEDGSNRGPVGPGGIRGMQTSKFNPESWSWHYERTKMNMNELAWQLQGCLGSVNGINVVDQTGLKGDYQVALDCPMSGLRPSSHGSASDMTASDPQGGRSVNRSLDAMGLKLEKRKVSMDVYVIDHAEKPSAD